jgi:hypothetical protein
VTGLPELVEGWFFLFFSTDQEGQAFDKLRQVGLFGGFGWLPTVCFGGPAH